MNESELVAHLRAAGCVFAEYEAALLLHHVSVHDLAAALAARVGGMPLEQVLGWAEFDGVQVAVEPGVFVPRQRSVLLVENAARLAPPGAVVLDLCCGSGALLAALLRRRPDVVPLAADLDPTATRVASRNLPDAAEVHTGDLFEALPPRWAGRIDVVLLNAPYVPTGEVGALPPEARDHEPALALDGGPDGLAVHRRALREARRWLTDTGTLLTEVAPAQVPTVRRLAHEQGFAARHVTDDRGGSIVCLSVG